MRVGSQVKSSAVETDKIRVLIADDHVTVLEGLAAIIGRQPDMMVVAEAADGQEAVDLWTEHHPDVRACRKICVWVTTRDKDGSD